jgi:cytoskeleton protein RodZ
VVLLWSPKSGESVETKVAAAGSPSQAMTSHPAAQKESVEPRARAPKPEVSSESAAESATHVAKTPASSSAVMHVDIEAREPAWVAVTDASGKRLLAKTFEANETYTLELTAAATLRTGNAGGLSVRFNGKEIGPLGPTGKIRDISFKDGSYKVHAPNAG